MLTCLSVWSHAFTDAPTIILLNVGRALFCLVARFGSLGVLTGMTCHGRDRGSTQSHAGNSFCPLETIVSVATYALREIHSVSLNIQGNSPLYFKETPYEIYF